MSDHYSGGGDKTIAKLEILDSYLWAYDQIMSGADWPRWYIDTHAGTGKTEIEEYEVVVDGSVLRAFEYGFNGYYLYEINPTRFDILCQTIEDHLGIDFSYGTTDETGDRRASCSDPYIQIINMDCNRGLEWLIDKSKGHRHWFAFIDPESLSVEVQLIEKLLERGRADILLNFQTTGIQRAASEGAEHAHPAVSRTLGDEWPVDADRDAYVEFFKEQIFEDTEFEARSRKMESSGSRQWRYDLIFASRAEVADKIMSQIMGKSLRDKVSNAIVEARGDNGSTQRGIEDFQLKYGDHEGSIKGQQSGLEDFF